MLFMNYIFIHKYDLGSDLHMEQSIKSISKQENNLEQKSFAHGLNFYKIAWIFIFFSIAGFLLETGWSYLYHGEIQSRKSLIFGPFSIIYGVGAVLLAFIINWLHVKRLISVFAIASIGGAMFEFMCSVIQELIFGTVSWDYGNKPYSIMGRTNLIFAVVWGALSVLAVSKVFPYLDHAVEMIPNNPGILITRLLVLFLVFDLFISATAVKRQTNRHMGIEAGNVYEQFLDKEYPDEVMDKIYVNMRVPKDKR